ncbi:MAG: LptE family protein [Acidobacteriota bacterium]
MFGRTLDEAMKRERTRTWCFLVLLVFASSGYTECYKPVGRGEAVPKHIKSLAIPPFQNPSLRFKVEQRFTGAVIDETLRRSRSLYVTSTVEGADAVLSGTIKSFVFRPLLLDDFGRARVIEVTVTMGVTVKDQTRNKVIFDNQNYVFRGEYEISGDPKSFFNEEGPATDRLAREFARSLVTTIWEGF